MSNESTEEERRKAFAAVDIHEQRPAQLPPQLGVPKKQNTKMLSAKITK